MKNEKLIEQLKDVIKQLEGKPEKQDEWWRWKPGVGDEYSTIFDFKAASFDWDDAEFDKEEYDNYHVFNCRKDAFRCHERQKAERAIVEYIKHANQTESGPILKYEWPRVGWQRDNMQLTVCLDSQPISSIPNDMYFNYERSAWQAIKDIGHHYKVWFGVE